MTRSDRLRHSRTKTSEGVSSLEHQYEYQKFMDASVFDTSTYVGFVFSRGFFNDHSRPLWDLVDSTLEGAKEYYAELKEENPEALRDEAVSAIVAGGWTFKAFCFTKS